MTFILMIITENILIVAEVTPLDFIPPSGLLDEFALEALEPWNMGTSNWAHYPRSHYWARVHWYTNWES